MGIRILIIEDNQSVAQTLSQDLGEHACEICPDFEQALQEVRTSQYDIIILDLFEGDMAAGNLAGERVLEQLWQQNFCPVIVNSANPEAGEVGSKYRNFFVARIEKGANNSAEVRESIEEFRPWVEKLQAVRKEVEKAIEISLRDVVGNMAMSNRDPGFLHRAARRRIAFQMGQAPDNRGLAPYEIYICPPPAEPEILQGSILLREGGDAANPADFFVVLTPSCDLVQGRRVENVLVAKCIAENSLNAEKRNRLKNKPYYEELVRLPEYPGVLPEMIANLKCLSLIERTQIGQYRPVALLDSPFREMLSWAYIAVAGRPGLPDVESD